jgi:damage-control phosphatase, subfamily I
MKFYPECYTCMLKQAVTAITLNENDPGIHFSTLRKVLHELEKADDRLCPPEISGKMNKIIRESLGVSDLYRDAKEAGYQDALRYLDDLRYLVRQEADLLEQGLKISAAGNIIDFIHASDYDLWEEVMVTINQKLEGGGLEVFRQRLIASPYLLYLADNVGETIFDRVFIETLDIPVIYVVKSGPILTDATFEDALAAGIDQVADVVETGSWAPGTVLLQTSEKFQQLFEDSPLVLSKGQANYETMDEKGEKVFFLLRTKCPVLSRRLDAPLGSLVFKQGNP